MLLDNPAQPWVKVEVPVLGGICAAQQAIAAHVPKRLMYVVLQGGSTTRRRRSKSSASTPGRLKHVSVHFDIDVLDPAHFHSTYFANPQLTGDGSGGGRMRIAEIENILAAVAAASSFAGLTIAEYLPCDEERLAGLFARLGVQTEE